MTSGPSIGHLATLCLAEEMKLARTSSIDAARPLMRRLALALELRVGGPYHTQALLRLGLTLAKGKYPVLAAVTVGRAGELAGLEVLARLPAREAERVLVAFIAEVLQLGLTLIGESAIRDVLHQVWPGLRLL